MEEKYINYYRLLFAILNSDAESENGYECPIIVYDKIDELPVGVFKNATTCGKFFNKSSRTILSIICRKKCIKRRYRLERIK